MANDGTTNNKTQPKVQLVFMPTLNHHDERKSENHSRMVRSHSMRNALAAKKKAAMGTAPRSPPRHAQQHLDPALAELDTNRTHRSPRPSHRVSRPSRKRPGKQSPEPFAELVDQLPALSTYHPSFQEAYFDLARNASNYEPLNSSTPDIDPTTHRLMAMYMSDRHQFDQLDPSFVPDLTKSIRGLWAPSIFGSPAGLYAMLAWIESTSRANVPGAKQRYGQYMAAALRETNRMLGAPDLDEEALSHIICIVLALMITSRRWGDESAANAHRAGILALCEAAKRAPHRAELSDQLTSRTYLSLQVVFFDQWVEQRASNERLTYLLDDPAASDVLRPGRGLLDLHDAGLLSCTSLTELRAFSAEHVDSAAPLDPAVADALWADVSREKARARSFEVAVFATLRLISHALVFGAAQPPCYSTANSLRLLQRTLAGLDASFLLAQHAHFVVWVCLVGGAAAMADGHGAGAEALPLLRQWRDVAHLRLKWSFEYAVEQVRMQFAWLPDTAADARRFWFDEEMTLEEDEELLVPCGCGDGL